MWPIFELTYTLFKREAVDFLKVHRLMLPSLNNFLWYGSDDIKGQPEYKQMLVDVYTTSMTNKERMIGLMDPNLLNCMDPWSICNPSSPQLSICLTTQVTPCHKPRSPRQRCSLWPLCISSFHRGSSSWHGLYVNELLLLLKRENMSLKHE